MAQTMKALVKREANKGIWLEQVAIPSPGPNEVLIKLEKTAICGTDLHIYLWDEWSQRTIKPGLTIGHVRDGYWLEDLTPLLSGAGLVVEDHRYYTGAVASRCCSLIYRRGLSFKAQWVLGPLLRPLAFAGERVTRRDNCASVAVLARKLAD